MDRVHIGRECPNAVTKDGRQKLCGCVTEEEWQYTLKEWEKMGRRWEEINEQRSV